MDISYFDVVNIVDIDDIAMQQSGILLVGTYEVDSWSLSWTESRSRTLPL